MSTITAKATKQGVIANTSMMGIKWNHRNTHTLKWQREREREQRTNEANRKQTAR